MGKVEQAEVSANAAAFIAANKRSPVVSGQGYPHGGGSYTLRSGKTFSLTLDEARVVGHPRWLGQ